MSRKVLITLVVILALALAGAVGFILWQEMKPGDVPAEPTTAPIQTTAVPTTQAPTTEVPTTSPTTVPAEATEAPTEIPTGATTVPTTAPVETEPGPERFLLSFVGDCTLGSTNSNYGIKHSFIEVIGEDYDYPFANVRQYFEADDFTFANLECVLSDERMYSSSQFSFRGPTAYTQILTGSSVEAVTLANNHTGDFGDKGITHTKEALDAAGITWVEKNSASLHKTESGLTIGMYGILFTFDWTDLEEEIAAMQEQGCDVIILAVHWGSEGFYYPLSHQKDQARKAIDMGVDIVYGNHSHVLQPVEQYGDGMIYYSLGNFSFGGNHNPPDMDTAILQQEVIRDHEGNVRSEEHTSELQSR